MIEEKRCSAVKFVFDSQDKTKNCSLFYLSVDDYSNICHTKNTLLTPPFPSTLFRKIRKESKKINKTNETENEIKLRKKYTKKNSHYNII